MQKAQGVVWVCWVPLWFSRSHKIAITIFIVTVIITHSLQIWSLKLRWMRRLGWLFTIIITLWWVHFITWLQLIKCTMHHLKQCCVCLILYVESDGYLTSVCCPACGLWNFLWWNNYIEHCSLRQKDPQDFYCQSPLVYVGWCYDYFAQLCKILETFAPSL